MDYIILSLTRLKENKHPGYLSHQIFPITTSLPFCSSLVLSILPLSYLKKKNNIQLGVLLEVCLYAHFQIDDFLVNGDTEERVP